jgi:hypothetical protein
MKNRGYSKIINFLGFQIGWFSSVLGAAWGPEWLGPVVVAVLVALNLYFEEERRNAVWLILSTAAVGTVLDSMLVSLGILDYKGNWSAPFTCPVWAVGLWINFALTLRSSLSWLSRRYLFSAVLGAVGGPMAYISGEALGAATLAPPPVGILAVAVAWAGVLPIVLKLEDLTAGRTPVNS